MPGWPYNHAHVANPARHSLPSKYRRRHRGGEEGTGGEAELKEEVLDVRQDMCQVGALRPGRLQHCSLKDCYAGYIDGAKAVAED